MRALAVAVLLALFLCDGAAAEQASAPRSAQAARLDAGAQHSCALLAGSAVRCWGTGSGGQLGTADTRTLGDDESPPSAPPVDVGPGRTARAIAAGGFHSCALLDDGSVRCWGFGAEGRLGTGNTSTIGDDESPGSVPPVDLGPGRTATAITAGSGHSCALLDDGSVRCWGFGANGRLGTGGTSTIGDDESPGSVPPVDLGPGRTATAITAGEVHTCAVLDDGGVRCWGYGLYGTLGYGNRDNVGDDEVPSAVAPVFLGDGRTALAITAGDLHTCVLLDTGAVRCWGYGGNGRLGYGNTRNIGDDELPVSAGTVDLGAGAVTAISAGGLHTCARIVDGTLRCWGYASDGRLGVCTAMDVGDDERPSALPPLDLESPASGCGAAESPVAVPAAPVAGVVQPPGPAGPTVPARVTAAKRPSAAMLRVRALRRCLASARRQPGRQRVRARRRCQARHGRVPGRVTSLRWRARSKTAIVLSFSAPGVHGVWPPAAREYVVKQSSRPIRGKREFARATSLCHGRCRFSVTEVGARIELTITGLRPRTTYFYSVAAYDSVSRRLGPRSTTLRARTR